jgi:hypothetical protein
MDREPRGDDQMSEKEKDDGDNKEKGKRVLYDLMFIVERSVMGRDCKNKNQCLP